VSLSLWMGLYAGWRLVAAGGDTAWTAVPPQPTVGDTVWLAREVAAPSGWRVRAGKLDTGGDVEPLGDAVVAPTADGFTIRYPVVAWTAGPHTVTMPLIWRLGPGGEADSVPGGAATIPVRSVLPADSADRASPKGLLLPIDPTTTSPWPAIAGLLIALGVLIAAVRLRRRSPRLLTALPVAEGVEESPDDRWLAAGEPKAVAARAAHGLRAALARVVPDASESLPAREALAAAEGRMPGATFRQVRDTLLALDQVAFAAAHGADVAALAARARALMLELAS
jgi:hypothetical protein